MQLVTFCKIASFLKLKKSEIWDNSTYQILFQASHKPMLSPLLDNWLHHMHRQSVNADLLFLIVH